MLWNESILDIDIHEKYYYNTDIKHYLLLYYTSIKNIRGDPLLTFPFNVVPSLMEILYVCE